MGHDSIKPTSVSLLNTDENVWCNYSCMTQTSLHQGKSQQLFYTDRSLEASNLNIHCHDTALRIIEAGLFHILDIDEVSLTKAVKTLAAKTV